MTEEPSDPHDARTVADPPHERAVASPPDERIVAGPRDGRYPAQGSAPGQYPAGEYPAGRHPRPPGLAGALRDGRRLAWLGAALAVLLVAVVVAVTFAGGDDDDQGGDGGFTRIESPAGFTVTLPSSWQVVDLTRPDAEARLKRLVRANTRLGDPDALYERLAGEGVLFAMAPARDGQSSANINVIKANEPLPDPFGEPEAAQLREQLETLGASVESVEPLRLDGRPAVSTAYVTPGTGPDGPATPVAGRQSYVSNGVDATFVLSATTTDPARDDDVVARIVESLRATP